MTAMGRTGLILTGALLAAVMAAAGAVALLYERDLAAARAAAEAGGTIVETEAGPIEYAENGGAGIPILSIHGAGGGYDQGLALAAGLFDEDYRVMAPSRFGYLRTPVPDDVSPAAQADAHAALLDALDVPKAIVFGVSAGTRSAVELALRHPEKATALILVVPAIYAPDSPVSIAAGRGNRFAFWAVNAGGDFAWWAAERIAPSVLVRFVGIPPELVATASSGERERVAAILAAVEPLSLRFRGINIDSVANLLELPLEKLSVPTLIVTARDDLFNTLPAATFAAENIPGAELVVFDTGGHLLVGRQEEVRAKVRDFLAGAGLTTPVLPP
jgi:pimeloyl-ACP methyl ester carboxylesterase